jgi:hypothetical protein
MNYLFEPRSDPGYDDDYAPSSGTGCSLREILLSPLIPLFMALYVLALAEYLLKELYGYTARTVRAGRVPWDVLTGMALLGVAVGAFILARSPKILPLPADRLTVVNTAVPTPRPTRTPFPTPRPTLNVPWMDEAAMLALVEGAQGTCADLLLSAWAMPGVYTYRITDDAGSEVLFTVELPVDPGLTNEERCAALRWDLAGFQIQPPSLAGDVTLEGMLCSYKAPPPYGSAEITVVGQEITRTHWGKMEALRVDATRSYHFATINDPHGIMAVSEYYVCGLGLVRAEQTIEEWYQRHGKKRTALLELVGVEEK